jgi:hypothetical protein
MDDLASAGGGLGVGAAALAGPEPAPWGRQLLARALRTTWWVWLFPLALAVALAVRSLLMLDYVHVLSAILWTGADLIMGFVIGPILRRLDPGTRLRVQRELLPRTLFYFPVMAGTTTTAGWYLAQTLGFMRPSSPFHGWFVAALALVAFMTVQGLGVLLPINLRVYGEMLRPRPDVERVRRLMGRYIFIVGFQGLLQIGIVFIMARFVMG